ncbi:MAG: hypothetical protein DWQ37_12365 [Planctomycetota bacterium]|nr:MAG: hypothetical protein DWQ37_12365 [Planctomycetota bacterium]
MLTLACVGLLGYVAVFFYAPLASSGKAERGEFLWTSILRPDDLVRAWIAGATWQGIVDRAVIAAVAAGIFAVVMAAGWTCLRLLRVDRVVTRAEMFVFSAGVGMNLVSLATLLLGLAGWLNRGAFLAVGIVPCIVAGAIYFRRGCKSGTCQIAIEQKRTEGPWAWRPRWLWLIAPFSAAILLSSMLPPLDFDVLEYHLQAPKEFFQAGHITFLPHNVYANMPLGSEMLALTAMVTLDDWWFGALVGKLLIGLFAPLTAIALYSAGSRFASPAAGVIAALVYISIPWVTLVSASGLIDGTLAFYLFAAFLAVLIWQSNNTAGAAPAEDVVGTRGLLAVSGFLAGASLATKYPGLVYCVLPLAAYVVFASWKLNHPPKDAFRRLIAPLGVFLLAAALACGPWLLKNAVLSGNPTYPLLYSVFDGATRTDAKDAQWRQAHRPPNYAAGDLARRVWDTTVAGAWLSPLVVPLAALAFVGPRTRRLALLVGGYVVFVFAAWWLLTHRIDRFLVPLWPLAALLAGIGATWTTHRVWRRSLLALLTLGLVYDFALISGGPVADHHYLTDLRATRTDPSRIVDPWHLYFNAHRDEVGHLLLVGDAEPFNLAMPTTYNTVFDTNIFEQLARDKSPEQVRQALEDRGITHIYVDWPEIERYRQPGNYGITDFLQRDLFDALVKAGVLERLPDLGKHPGKGFRVVDEPSS